MLTVLLTCLLTAGVEFVQPAGWTVEKVVGGGKPEISLFSVHPVSCVDSRGMPQLCPEPVRLTRVLLRRQISPGESATVPEGCTAEVRHDPDNGISRDVKPGDKG